MHMQRKHQMLGAAQAPSAVGQLRPQRNARQQQEHGAAQVAEEAVLQGFDLTQPPFGVDVDAPLDAMAYPVGQGVAKEHTIAHAGPAAAQVEGDLLFSLAMLGGSPTLMATNPLPTTRTTRTSIKTSRLIVKFSRKGQQIVLAPTRQVPHCQRAGLDEQQRQAAPQRALGGEVARVAVEGRGLVVMAVVLGRVMAPAGSCGVPSLSAGDAAGRTPARPADASGKQAATMGKNRRAPSSDKT